MPTWCNKVIFLMCSKLDMFRVHTPVIMSIRCWVAAYGFLHRVSGWVVVLKAAAWVVCTVRMVHGTIRTVHTTHAAAFNIQCSWWWAYVPETCLAKNILRKVPCCIKLAFHFISLGRWTVKHPTTFSIRLIDTAWIVLSVSRSRKDTYGTVRWVYTTATSNTTS